MKAIDFAQRNKLIAEDQPEFETLPVFHDHTIEGHPHVMCFELDEEERKQVAETGKIFFVQYLAAVPVFPPIGMTCLDPFKNNISLGNKLPVFDLQDRIKTIVRVTGCDGEKLSAVLQIVALQGYAGKTEITQLVNLGLPMFNVLSRVMQVRIIQIPTLAKNHEVTTKHIIDAINSLTSEGGEYYVL